MWYAKDVEDSLEVVFHTREAEFSSRVHEPRHKARALIIGVFERPKGVSNDGLSLRPARRVGFEPLRQAPVA